MWTRSGMRRSLMKPKSSLESSGGCSTNLPPQSTRRTLKSAAAPLTSTSSRALARRVALAPRPCGHCLPRGRIFVRVMGALRPWWRTWRMIAHAERAVRSGASMASSRPCVKSLAPMRMATFSGRRFLGSSPCRMRHSRLVVVSPLIPSASTEASLLASLLAPRCAARPRVIESPRKSCLGCGLRRVAVCTASTLPSCISAHLAGDG
mmetsp:Transcript_13542/g.32092  ORF Transcript_13542/g.32092 Transcript_13542/m.32092 type:complete len:207 (+) Transcript_13542:218-838(+)